MYYTVENGKDECLYRASSKIEGIKFCIRNNDAQEVFEYTDNDELIGCVYNKVYVEDKM